MLLDTRTLSVMLVITAICFSVVALFLYRTRKTYPGFLLWAYGNILAVAGFALIFFRDDIPFVFSILVGNLLVLSYNIFMWLGLQQFYKRSPNRWEILSLYAALTVFLIYGTFVHPDIDLRISGISLTLGYISIRTSWFLFKNAPIQQKIESYLGGFSFLFYGLVNFLRGVLVHFEPSHLEAFFYDSQLQTVFFVSTLIFIIFTTIGIISLHSKRLELELIETQERLRHMAITDSLTGVFNHRYFYEIGKAQALQSMRYGHPLAVMIFDIDHFKQVNDNYGHLTGDQLLIETVNLCRGLLRNADVLSRLGGDEFAVLMPHTDLNQATLVAERLREAFAQATLLPQDPSICIYISVGVSVHHPDEPDIEPAVHRADLALYDVKRGQRNQVLAFA